MSKQLKMRDIVNLVKALEEEGMSRKEVLDLPVYIGNDDELNGIHCAWYNDLLDPDNDCNEDLIEMINEDHHNLKCTGKAILIS